MAKGTIIYQDKYGASAHTTIKGSALTLAKLQAHAEWLKAHSDAAIVGYGLVEEVNDDTATAGHYNTIYARMELIFKDAKGIHRFSVMAPAEGSVGEKEQPTSDFAKDFSQELVALGALEAPFKYLGGQVKMRGQPQDARDKDMTGV